MGKWKQNIERLRKRLLGRRSRWLMPAAMLAVLGGVLLLVFWSNASPYSAALSTSSLAGNLADLRTELSEAGIVSQNRGDTLYVRPQDLERARGFLKRSTKAGNEAAGSFEDLAAAGGMWRTESQNMRLWQARKMSELGRLISQMKPVQVATVLFEPGREAGLGKSAREATAAVHVELRDGYRMTPRLIVAIGELVSGSISSLDCGDVRIVDASGASYRADASVVALEARNAQEAAWEQKIQQMLGSVPGARVTVTLGGETNSQRLLRVHVILPSDASKARKSFEAEIRKTVLAIAGDKAHVTFGILERVTARRDKPDKTELSAYKAGALGLFVGILMAWLLPWLGRNRKRRIRKTSRERSHHVGNKNRISEQTTRDDSKASGPFDYLAEASGRQILNCLQDEQPQTIAVVLKQLDESQRQEVLSGLSDVWKDEVSRQLLHVQELHPEVVEEIAAEVAGRLAQPTPQSESIQPVEPKVRQSVLPAQSIVFEDLLCYEPGQLSMVFDAVTVDDLAIAMRTASGEMKRRVLSTVSAHTAKRIRRRMDEIGPVRLSEVEAAQQRIVDTLQDILHSGWVSDSTPLQMDGEVQS